MRGRAVSSASCAVLVIALAVAASGCEAIFAPIAAVLTPTDYPVPAEVKLSRGDSIAIALVDARERRPRRERPFTDTLTRLIKSELDMHTRATSAAATGQAADLAAEGRLPAAADAAGTDLFLLGRVTILEAKPPDAYGILRGTIEVEASVYNARDNEIAYSGRIKLHYPKHGELMIGEMPEREIIEILLVHGARDIGRLFYDYKITRSEMLDRRRAATR